MNRGALPRHSVRSSSTPPVPPAPLPVLHSAKPQNGPTTPSAVNYPPPQLPQPYQHHPQHPPHPHLQYYPPHHSNFLPPYPYNTSAPVAASPSPPPTLLQPQLQESLHFTSQKPQNFSHQTPSSHLNYTPAQYTGSYTPASSYSSHSYTPPSPSRSAYNSTPVPTSPPVSRQVYTPPPAPSLTLDNIFHSEKAFEEVKKTIANTLRNASSTAPSPPTSLASSKRLIPPDDASVPLTTMQLSTSLNSSSSIPNIASAAQQVKSVKAIVSRFTSQLQSAASSKNTNEFIDLLSKFSTEYATVMRNEDNALNSGLSVVAPAVPNGAIHIKHEDYASPDVRVAPRSIEKSNGNIPPPPAGDNTQIIKEMQELASALKTKVKTRALDRDQKIQQISEDILTVMKAQYTIDMQAAAEHATQRLQQAQDRHIAELRSTTERYERKIQEMTEQYEHTNQMLRERMLMGSGAGEDAKRENAQLRSQISTLQMEIKGYEERLRAADEYRREQRRKDLMLGTGHSANDEIAALNRNEQLQDLQKELQEKNTQIEELQALNKEKESLASTQEAQARASAKKEQELVQKISEMESMNKALRSSIQQMHERSKK